jgi:hypothetical protein
MTVPKFILRTCAEHQIQFCEHLSRQFVARLQNVSLCTEKWVYRDQLIFLLFFVHNIIAGG